MSTRVASSSVLAVVAWKGGVAKSSSVANLAAAFSAAGRRVLVIDTDPQGGVAPMLGIAEDDLGAALRDALLHGAPLSPVTAREGIDICLGGPELAAAAVELPRSELPWQWALADALAAVDGYDNVVIDTPPGLGALTMVSLVAARQVIIPTSLDPSSYRTLDEVLGAIDLVRRRPAARPLNPTLTLAGVLPTIVDLRSKLAVRILERLRARPELAVLEPPIPSRVAVREAALQGVPVVIASPSNPAAIAYRAVAATLLEKTA